MQKHSVYCVRTLGAMLTLSLILLPTVNAATGYVCVVDQATGFSQKRDGQWVQTGFKPGTTYNVSRAVGKDAMPSGSPPRFEWVVKEVGSERTAYRCPDFNPAEILRCGGVGGTFILDKKALRFQYTYEIGYVFYFGSGDTPYIAIGKCSPY
jgi:hypothetical protein